MRRQRRDTAADLPRILLHYTFFDFLIGGGGPMPVYPPAQASQVEGRVRRRVAIVANAQAVVLVATPPVRPISAR